MADFSIADAVSGHVQSPHHAADAVVQVGRVEVLSVLDVAYLAEVSHVVFGDVWVLLFGLFRNEMRLKCAFFHLDH